MRRATGPAALLIAALLAFAATATARAQLSIGMGAEASPVLSNKDFAAVLEDVAMDDAQRQVAFAAFDDAQDRMFDAAHAANAVRRRVGDSHDEQRLAELEQSRRALAQSVLGSVDALFQQVSVMLRADQHEALDRARLATKRRIVRAMLGSSGIDGAVSWDVERAIAESSAPAEAKAAAYKALGGYRQRLGSLLQRMLDNAILQKRRTGPTSRNGPDGDLAASMLAMVEAQRSAQEVIVQLAAAHRDALAALEPVLPPADLAKVRAATAQRVWPRTAMDPDSPRQVIESLLGGRAAPDARAAIEAARDAWQPRWWVTSLRMTVAEDALRASAASAIFGGKPDESKAKQRTELRALRTERRSIDIDAWKALADADPAHREFLLKQAAAAPAGRGEFRQAPTLPKEGEAAEAPAMSGAIVAAGAAEVVAGAGATGDVAVSMMTISVGNGDDDEVAFNLDGADGGGVVMVMSGNDGPVVFGDSFGDGLGANLEFSGVSFAEPGSTEGGVRVRLPKAMPAEECEQLARTLGLDPANPSFRTMVDDYHARSREMDERLGAPFRDASHPQALELPAERAKDAPMLVDAYVEGLAAVDDAFIGNVAAAAGAADGPLRAARDERAAARARRTRYATGVMGSASPSDLDEVRLGAVIASTELSPADRASATDAWVAWSPSARAAAEQWRAACRSGDARWLEQEREAMAHPLAAGGHAEGEAVALGQERINGVMEIASAQSAALQAITRANIAGERAVEAALPEPARRSLREAWNRAAAPAAYADRKDAMPALDAASVDPALSDEQRSQVNALRGAHAARHREACDRLAELVILNKPSVAEAMGVQRIPDANVEIAAERFERQELNARSTRRLRAIVSPAPTPPEPSRTSP